MMIESWYHKYTPMVKKEVFDDAEDASIRHRLPYEHGRADHAAGSSERTHEPSIYDAIDQCGEQRAQYIIITGA